MSQIIRLKDLLEKLGISRTTLWRLERQGVFIPRVQISMRTVGYLETDVEEFLKRHTIADNKMNIATVGNEKQIKCK
jgi:predicted DNA-binding transcriptional regulator AlpA